MQCKRSRPLVFPGRSEFGERRFHADYAEAKSKTLVGADLSQLVMCHEFDDLRLRRYVFPALPPSSIIWQKRT